MPHMSIAWIPLILGIGMAIGIQIGWFVRSEEIQELHDKIAEIEEDLRQASLQALRVEGELEGYRRAEHLDELIANASFG